MLKYLIPQKENNHKAKLLSNKFLAITAVGLFLFNFFTPVNINAQSESDKINETTLLSAHNQFRVEHQLPMLKINPLLNLSAQNKANEMLRNDCWSHYCPDGKSPWDFFASAGYDYSFAGENLAEGYYKIDDVMTAWINSESHRENLLNNKYTEVGFGIVTGNYQGNANNVVVVVHFGTLKENTAIDYNQSLIKITSPSNGQVVITPYIDLTGKAFGFSEVNIYTNDNYLTTQNVNEGIFTYKLDKISDGKNTVMVKGVSTVSKDLNIEDQTSFTQIPNENYSLGIRSILPSISQSAKINVNLIFAFLLAILFLIDFILLSRTDFVKKLKSYSHYHFAIFAIISLIILVGGFAGNIGSGFSI